MGKYEPTKPQEEPPVEEKDELAPWVPHKDYLPNINDHGQVKSKKFIRVPHARQATNYTCGISCVQSIMHYYGDEFREDILERAMNTNKQSGVDQKEIVEFARSRGYFAETYLEFPFERILEEVDKGHPIILCIQAWADWEDGKTWSERWDDGHYVVCVGYDDDNMYFMDPSSLGAYTYIPREEFKLRFHDGYEDLKEVGMTVLMYKDTPKYDEDVILYLA